MTLIEITNMCDEYFYDYSILEINSLLKEF